MELLLVQESSQPAEDGRRVTRVHSDFLSNFFPKIYEIIFSLLFQNSRKIYVLIISKFAVLLPSHSTASSVKFFDIIFKEI